MSAVNLYVIENGQIYTKYAETKEEFEDIAISESKEWLSTPNADECFERLMLAYNMATKAIVENLDSAYFNLHGITYSVELAR